MADHPRSETDARLARKGRTAGLVIAVSMVAWLGAQLIGGWLGLPARYAFLIDFAAIAALIWALVVTWQLWQARGGPRPPNGG
ncbi:DUF5337 domain-containing protein [Mangrovicoccus algicola]|uniref:DUF5337 domain-containing protein n=1 Tax=Mangrovicoccus algicola TaxID=2771008 RepID=A0A8J7CXA9_9RHOB|nr:DUF5337 domain-containing protein [Mangrovicoccus algicola]MBE3638727.1 DUF5337 domain-containing protein [Mangrovicoccus algicola]